jgi:mRNA interferase MazF
MIINKFHIYLADLNPRFGTEPGKVRPVIVIQTDSLNHIHPSTIILPITTNIIEDASILRVHLPKDDTNLKQDSAILMDQIRAIDNKSLIKHIGKLKEEYQSKILKNLKIILID